MTMTVQPSVDLIVLCGFLGSGKTTLLVDFLQQDQLKDTAVIVNEAGEIGIDGTLINEGTDDFGMTLLANGCVCCSLRSNLVDTVTELLETPRPDGAPALARIILETSGISRPGPILASLADEYLARRGLRVSVVTTFDAELGGLRQEQFDEAASQLAAAQKIVFTKLDKVDNQALSKQIAQASLINPLAELIHDRDRSTLVRNAFQIQPEIDRNVTDLAVAAMTSGSFSQAHSRLHVMKGVTSGPLDWESLSHWLDDLAGVCGEKLLRVKALVHVSDCDEPILIQGVGTTYSMPRRMTKKVSSPDVMIIMTRDISSEEIMMHLTDTTVTLYPINDSSKNPAKDKSPIFPKEVSHAIN